MRSFPTNVADWSGKKRRPVTVHFQICEVHFGPCEISRETQLQKRSQKSRKVYTFTTNYSVNSHAFVLETALAISLKNYLGGVIS